VVPTQRRAPHSEAGVSDVDYTFCDRLPAVRTTAGADDHHNSYVRGNRDVCAARTKADAFNGLVPLRHGIDTGGIHQLHDVVGGNEGAPDELAPRHSCAVDCGIRDAGLLAEVTIQRLRPWRKWARVDAE
jgi:hypothetical protein